MTDAAPSEAKNPADPGTAISHFNRGNDLLAQDKPREAEASYRRALAFEPNSASMINNLGTALKHQDRFDEAVANYRRAIALDPGHASAHFNLANTLRDQDKLAEAEASYRQAVALDPSRAEYHCALGDALRAQDRLAEAIDPYRHVIALSPRHYIAHFNLALGLQRLRRSVEAAASCRQALAIKPDYAPAYSKLAEILKFQGRAGEATAYYRRALELAPDSPAAHSSLLLCLQYDPAMTPASLLIEHRAYAARLSSLMPPGDPPTGHANPPDPDRPLKIGYVSADLRQHPVGLLMMPVLAAHDSTGFVTHCYYGHRKEDAVTAHLKSHAKVWRSTVGADDDGLAGMIRADGIDILVDLAGHTLNNRLPVFARKPAPVQASWAGYFGTTGLSAIDYLITDRFLSPPGSERYAVEKLARLPDGYLCWAMPGHAPQVGPLPATVPGAVTFGCFNNLAKINPLVIALWGRLLRELPESRLILKTRELDDPAVCDRFRALFAIEGITDARLVLEGPSPHPDYLRRYNDIDIALDPFPYSGGLTTVDALWMGVPVITMPGERWASRHSLSHLSAAGLTELVADGPEAYLRTAVQLARDLPRLASLRAGLRPRMHVSPLRRAKAFTRGLEKAYRAMWRSWCETRVSSAHKAG